MTIWDDTEKSVEEDSYNVYAWYRRKDGTTSSAVKVCTHVPLNEATVAVDAYMHRGLEWDAYLVPVWDDPEEVPYGRD